MSAAIASIEHPLYSDSGEIEGTWVAMPDAEIANLGKSRQEGVFWLCGDYAEGILTSTSFLTGICPPEGQDSGRSMTPEEVSKRVGFRAQKQVRRLVNTNHLTTMWTFTFCPDTSKSAHLYRRPTSIKDQRDYDTIRYYWKLFLRRLERVYPGVRWLVVFEFHNSEKTSENKRETFHLHWCVDQYINWKIISDVWGHGNVRFDDFQAAKKERKGAVNNPGAYVSKYVSKEFPTGMGHKKRYTTSRNISRPTKITPGTFLTQYREGAEVVFNQEKTFEWYDTEIGIGGTYGVTGITYKLAAGAIKRIKGEYYD